MKQKDIEDRIMDNWAEYSSKGACKDHQTAVLNYLNECRQLRCYGSATFSATLLDFNGEEFGGEVYLCANDQGILILNGDEEGQEIDFIPHGEYKIEIVGTENITLNGPEESVFHLNFFGAEVFMKMLKFI